VPLVRRTGGLADTIVDADHDLARGNGFVFDEANSRALLEAAERASHAYRDVSRWHSLIDHGMSEDFSWSRSARRYAEEYVRAVTIHAARTALASSVGSAARRG
jgi:starch synthase